MLPDIVHALSEHIVVGSREPMLPLLSSPSIEDVQMRPPMRVIVANNRKPFASDADRVALLFKRYQALTDGSSL